MRSLLFSLAAIAIVAAAIMFAPLPGPPQDATRLDRLARRVESAATLSPDAHAALASIAEAARKRPPTDDARRRAALERLTKAIEAKAVAQADVVVVPTATTGRATNGEE